MQDSPIKLVIIVLIFLYMLWKWVKERSMWLKKEKEKELAEQLQFDQTVKKTTDAFSRRQFYQEFGPNGSWEPGGIAYRELNGDLSRKEEIQEKACFVLSFFDK